MTEDLIQPTDQPSAEPPLPPQETVPLNAATGEAGSPSEGASPDQMGEPSPGDPSPKKEEVPPTPEPEKKPPSRFKRFVNRLLWTLAAILVVFIAGGVTAMLVFYRPLKAQNRSLERQLQQVQEEKATLEVRKADLKAKWQDAQNRLAELEKQTKDLAAACDQAQTMQYLYAALADTYAAQLALNDQNPTSARLYLSDVQASLRLLKERVPNQQDVFTEMNQRVDKAMQTLSTSPLTAQGELSALADYLLQLKNLVAKK